MIFVKAIITDNLASMVTKFQKSQFTEDLKINLYVFFWNMRREVVLAVSRVGIFLSDWIFTTNHRRLAILYFWFIAITGFTGLILATIIRLELAYPGKFFLAQNAERYLTVISLHGIVMVFFVVIPVLFGAFGNFLLPTQLGIRDVAFPRLNSFMFWVTPAGFVLLLHILLFDKAYNVTYWVNYSELRSRLRRRYNSVEPQLTRFHEKSEDSVLALRLMSDSVTKQKVKNFVLSEEAPLLVANNIDVWSQINKISLSSTFLSIKHMYSVVIGVFLLEVKTALVTSVRGICSYFLTGVVDFFVAMRQITSLRLSEDSVDMCRTIFDFMLPGISASLYGTSLSDSYSGITTYRFARQCVQLYNFVMNNVCTFTYVSTHVLYDDIYAEQMNSTNNVSRFLLNSFSQHSPLLTSTLSGWNLNESRLFFSGHRNIANLLFNVTSQWINTGWEVSYAPSLSYTTDEYNQLQAVVHNSKLYFFRSILLNMLDLTFFFKELIFNLTLGVHRSFLQKKFTDVNFNNFVFFEHTGDRAFYSNQHSGISLLPWSKFFKSQILNRATFNFNFDYFLDWRELKLEREVWRSLDMLNLSRQQLNFRKKYYADLFQPASITNKVSTWLPNHLIPGWAFVTPYTSRLRYTAVGKVDIALIVVFAASLGSVFSSVNYVITYRYIGAPILKNRRELRSFFVDALLVASRMMLLANPALLIGILLLLSDRHFNTSVFDFSGGGDTILFQHLFWFFGHPEVYIIIIPCFGFMNSLLPIYLRKRLSGRLSLQFSMYTIAFMGFAVWGHHMYMVGLANSVRTLYSTMTVMISVPASTKVLHWCVTLIQSTLVLDVGFLFLLNFMYFFVLGGLSGMFVAHIGFDTIFHDTFYVIGHFHVMLAGAAVSCIFAAFYFYFSAIFGIRYSRFFAYLHYGFYTSGQLLTLIPMFWLGYAGMPRRIMDYPSVFGGWHSLISSGHFLTVLSLIFFLFMLLDSFYENRAPVARMRGVSRLNTRLAFYAYESRKLRYCQTRALVLNTGVSSRADLFRFCWNAETVAVEYVFVSTGGIK
jgi:heme/copper-type cytochrome/quinol oxidase subunit 1